jgi:hypothetical protein
LVIPRGLPSVVAAVAEQDLSGLGQALHEFILENSGVFAVGGVDADGSRPKDAYWTTERQRVQAVAKHPLSTAALAPMCLLVNGAAARQLPLVALLLCQTLPLACIRVESTLPMLGSTTPLSINRSLSWCNRLNTELDKALNLPASVFR